MLIRSPSTSARAEASEIQEIPMKQSPLAAVKARFDISEQDPTLARKAAKEKLVAAVKALTTDGLWIDRLNENTGLELISNKKLLHLHDVLTAVQEFGGRDAVIKAIVDADGRKDEGYAARFAEFPTPKLWDHYGASKKAAKKAAKRAN